jgi:CubicO group peptidase (beta-lactamase class C family)
VYSRAVGRLAYGDAPAPPRDNGTNPAADFRGTLFDMASLTKILGPTTVAALLFQSGDLALDELVASPKLLGPAFAAAGKGAVTVRHLLLHAAGFPPDPVPNFNDASFGCPNSAAAHPALDFSCADKILAAVNAQPLINIPGAVYLYSDLSMITLALALGRFFATQRPQWVPAAAAGPACAAALAANPASLGVRYTCAFTSFWRTNVSAAVGLAPTSGYLPPDAAATAPTWLDDVYRHEQLQGVVSDENSYALGGIAGHAGIFASGADAARFLAAWGPGSTLLNASTIALFTTRANEPAGSARALGWSTEADSYAGCAPMAADTAYHTGYTGTQLCLGKNYSTVLLAARVYPNKTGNVDAIHALRQEFNAAVAAAWGERPAFAFPWQDPSLPLAERAAIIISLLTLEEKAAQLEAGAPAVPRIALPAYSYARECERGDSSGRRGTAFPSGAGLAASWDADLIFRVARATALEARANANTGDGAPSCFGPVVNFVHDATWGRTNEMLTGEDTTLGATLGAAFVAGLQSWREATPAGERLAVASTVKHLNAYSGPEGHGYTFGPFAERFSFDAHMSQRAWREFFVPAFRATAREGARAFMCSCVYRPPRYVRNCARNCAPYRSPNPQP